MDRGAPAAPERSGAELPAAVAFAMPVAVADRPRARRRWPLLVCLVLTIGLYHRQAADDLDTLVYHLSGDQAAPVADADAPFDLVALHRGRAGRWNPCEPVRWVVNLESAPPWAMEDLTGAFDRMAAATGLTFEFGGATAALPSEEWTEQAYEGRPGWPPMIIAWADETETAYLDGEVAGMGGVTLIDGVVVSGFVAIDEDTSPFPRGFDQPGVRTHGGLLLHELGHALGLGHVDDPGQVMAQTGAANELASGDLAGLRHVGAEGGCLDVPSPPW